MDVWFCFVFCQCLKVEIKYSIPPCGSVEDVAAISGRKVDKRHQFRHNYEISRYIWECLSMNR